MDWAALLAALLEWVKSLFPSAATAVAVHEIEKGRADSRELAAVDAATKAAAAVDGLSDADVVRQLKERGLYRVRGEPGDGEQ